MNKIKINGKEYNWKIKSKPRNNCSSLHVLAKQIIKEIFPYEQIFEEVFIPKIKLYLDILLLLRRICIEINGEQHFRQISHFHSNKLEFLKSQNRDRIKAQVLQENDIKLIVLKYNESNLWKQQIINQIKDWK